ncbi:hypothetical protein [Peterkaempfera griseoplana]|nr:hypothetical protein [Peterkaempfera griseoplana]
MPVGHESGLTKHKSRLVRRAALLGPRELERVEDVVRLVLDL